MVAQSHSPADWELDRTNIDEVSVFAFLFSLWSITLGLAPCTLDHFFYFIVESSA
jgi:hypothetical protein